MQDIPARVKELPTDTDIVVLCHHGMRSLQVAQFLKQSGLERVSNLSGGIAAWAAQVDPDMSQY
jgi:rhodanese-related sulfurtransferase